MIEIPTNFHILEEKPHAISTFQIINGNRDSVKTAPGNET